MKTHDVRRTGFVCALAVLTPLVAFAQQPDQGATPASQGPMKIEVQQNGAVFAPDVRITEIDGTTGTLVGGYAGWLTDGTWLIGGAGYWLANGAHDRGLSYGGLLVQWMTGSRHRVAFAAGGLVGGGMARLGDTVTYPGYPGHPGRPGVGDRYGYFGDPSTGRTARLIYDQGVFVAEPQVSVVLNVTSLVRFGVGVGYRAVAGAGRDNDRLSGVSGTVSLQIGGGS